MRAFVALVLSSLLVTCSSPPTLLGQILSNGELVFVTRNSPTTYYLGPESPKGIEYELARGFAERLGVEFRIHSADQISPIFPAVANGDAHIGAAALTVTAPRAQLVDFGPEYEAIDQIVIYRRGTKRPRSTADLEGGRIEIAQDSAHIASLELARQEYPGIDWTTRDTANAEELVRRVTSGESDYTIVDSNVYDLLRQYHPEAGSAFVIGEPRSLAWALPKGAHELKEAVSAYFAELEATGQLAEIHQRYYFAAQDFDYVGNRAFVRHVESRLPKYRAYFEEAALATGLDWRLIAAISYQESHWNPLAVSPTGVRGMMMLTEQTAEIVQIDDRSDARQSILGGAAYLIRVRDKIPERIDEQDRLWMALAGYNIGFGHLEDARIITEINGADPDSWAAVRRHLPLLSDEEWHSRVKHGYARGNVPVLYVDNVRRYYELLHFVVDDDIENPEPWQYKPSRETTASLWVLDNILNRSVLNWSVLN